jgi:hypothetical protein
MVGQRAYRAFWCEVGVGTRIYSGIKRIGWGTIWDHRMVDCWEWFPLSATESQTRTRGRVTTTISCVRPATQHGSTTRFHTQSRGTPIDAGDFRGTGLRIMYIVTSCNNRHGAGGVAFWPPEKRGNEKPAFQFFCKGELSLSLRIFQQVSTTSLFPLTHISPSHPLQSPRCYRMGTCQVVIPLAHCVYHPAPL